MGSGHPRHLFQETQGRCRDHHPQAQRDGLRTGRTGFRALPDLRRQQGAKGRAANYSFVLRGYVRHWLGNVWAEYDRIKLNEITLRRPPTARASGPLAAITAGSKWSLNVRGDSCNTPPDAALYRRRRTRALARRCSRGASVEFFPTGRPVLGYISIRRTHLGRYFPAGLDRPHGEPRRIWSV